MELYVVKEGDSVDSIAAAHSISAEDVIWANQIEYPYRLAVGQALLILSGSGTESQGRPALYSFGYAYPFINSRTLQDTLPFLTDLYVFSYGFTEEGNLVHPMSDDAWMIEAAKNAGVRPVLTLTPLGADGKFNNNLVSALVQDPAIQQHLIWELGRTMQERGFMGLDIDFEYILAEDRVGFVEFVSLVRSVMNSFGYPVTVALAPKTSADQKGLLYEGVDYRLLGQAADRVMLMTYEWGYSQGPPMAVAPLNMVRRVVNYAVSEIPREKISLGIPNYGYDWPLPYEQGVTRARTIHNLEAIQIAVDHGVQIQFDTTAMSPYFRYWQYGIQHEVWFEDPRSILAKFELIQEYDLTGAGYWQLMNFFRSNWLMMRELFQVIKM
ncbi:MAG: glycosyl hydrolase family 18 protein [Lachnospiraceae bacterium]|nr:glycosyl hydrolase family 18 protein [Lachnospiraceae bacterium]